MLINAEYSPHVLPELIIHSQMFQEFVEDQHKKKDEKLNKHKRGEILMYINLIILFIVIFSSLNSPPS
jgi:cytoskeletal protein RodZ